MNDHIHYTESEEQGIKLLGLNCEVYDDLLSTVVRRLHAGEDITDEQKKILEPIFSAIYQAQKQITDRGEVPGFISVHEHSVQVWPILRGTTPEHYMARTPSNWIQYKPF